MPIFCTNCAASLDADAKFCPSCSAPVTDSVPLASESRGGAQMEFSARLKTASKDASHAFRSFATNPVGGLPVSFAELGAPRAMGVGIVFAVFSILCVFIGVYVALPAFSKPDFGDSLKFIVFGAVPFVSLLAASAATRKIFGGVGSVHGDSFIAGAALLPFGLLVLVSSILGLANLEIAALLVVFALCYGILMLYTGVTRISNVSESRAAFAVPVMIIVSFWLTKIIFGAMLPSLFSSPGRFLPWG